MDKILMWKRYTNSGFKLMKFANPFPPAYLLHFLLFKGFQPGSMFLSSVRSSATGLLASFTCLFLVPICHYF